MLLGTLAAWLVALTTIRGKQVWVFTFILPLMIPPQVTALAWIQALSPSSLVMQGVGMAVGLPIDRSGPPAALFAGRYYYAAGFAQCAAGFSGGARGANDLPADLVEAARITGASPLRVLFTVVLPLARPAIFAGAALSFVAAAGNFGIQAMLGIPGRVPTLITLVYQQLNTTGPAHCPIWRCCRCCLR